MKWLSAVEGGVACAEVRTATTDLAVLALFGAGYEHRTAQAARAALTLAQLY